MNQHPDDTGPAEDTPRPYWEAGWDASPVRHGLDRLPRLLGWLLLCLAASAAVWLLAPQQLPVSLYKFSLVSSAAVAGYWLDRSLFPYARPDALLYRCACAVDAGWRLVFAAAMLRRAIVVAAAMLAMGMGA